MFHPKSFPEELTHCLHPQGFGVVMTTQPEPEPEVPCKHKGVMIHLTCEHKICTTGMGFPHESPGVTAHDGDLAQRPGRYRFLEGEPEALLCPAPRDPGGKRAEPPDRLPFVRSKGGQVFQAKTPGKEDVISQARMGIQGEMEGVHPEPPFPQDPQDPVSLLHPGEVALPEETVVHKEELGSALKRLFQGCGAGIHCRGYFGNFRRGGYLQPVLRPGIVRESPGIKGGIKESDDLC